jgi:nicotinamide-nucleotide amidase
VIYAVPGVPFEMREMMLGTILPDLQRRAGVPAVILSRTLRTWGQSESGLAEQLAGRIEELDRLGNPTLAFLASGIEGLKVRITVKAGSEAEAAAMIAEEEARCRAILGDVVFGIDDESMESVVLEMLRQRRMSLAVAESVTGGMVGSRLTAIPGASDIFRGAVVAYHGEVKFKLLGVPQGPVVTAEAARAMADGVRRALGADVGLSTTGVAGPSEQEGQPVGTVWCGLAIGDKVQAELVRLPGNRERIRQYAVINLLNLLRHRLAAAGG